MRVQRHMTADLPRPADAPAAALSAQPTTAARGPARIALFGLFGCGNLGNDGSLQAMLEYLAASRPSAEIVCICDDRDVVRHKFGVSTIPISGSRESERTGRSGRSRLGKIPGKVFDLFRAVRQMRGFDVMIVPGTGILDDFGERPYGMPYDLFRWCLAARLSGTRIAFVSIGAGPIRNDLSRRLMAAAARLADYRSYRDHTSKAFMESIGFDVRNDPVYPDIAFRLSAPPENRARVGKRGTVGVGVMRYRGWYGFKGDADAIYEDYMAKLGIFLVFLLDHGYDIRLLTGETSDDAAVADVMQRLRLVRPQTAEARIVAEPSASLHDLMKQIAQTDVVVATRFHNIVCSLKMGRPTISLGYAKKNDVLMAEAGLGGFCQHVERFDVGLLIEQFQDVMEHRETCEDTVRSRTRSFERQLQRQDEMLLASILC